MSGQHELPEQLDCALPQILVEAQPEVILPFGALTATERLSDTSVRSLPYFRLSVGIVLIKIQHFVCPWTRRRRPVVHLCVCVSLWSCIKAPPGAAVKLRWVLTSLVTNRDSLTQLEYNSRQKNDSKLFTFLGDICWTEGSRRRRLTWRTQTKRRNRGKKSEEQTSVK